MTTTIENNPAPQRGPLHEALAVFLGAWKAEGTSFGGSANGTPWVSEHQGYWHTGEFFLVQDEKARPGGEVFDTLSVMGVEPATGQYFARCLENHGFYRHYGVRRDGDAWTFSGETERATVTFSDGNRKQTIRWEWKPKGKWLPLCDRVAVRTNARAE